ncbi:MAG: fibronectin type III domain-containing protein [Candidatus Electrothrix sp. MAN1_4]|nr:fibronectin type III domain-containing protein [Candidatus Electrothrix sp. MAN1_4]
MPDAPSKPAPPVLDGIEEQARGENFLNIRWTASNAVRYRIQCNSEIKEFSGADIPYKTTFSNLPHNTKHILAVVALNEDGDSAKSDHFECYTRPIPPQGKRI